MCGKGCIFSKEGVFSSWTLRRAVSSSFDYPLNPQSSVTPIMSSLDYSKWDKLEDSDDEKEAQEGGNGGNGGGVVRTSM